MAANKRLLMTGLIVFLLGLAVIIGYFQLRKSDVRPIRIGIISPLTGSAAHLSDVGTGVQMAAEEINEWGGINGRPVQVIIDDSQTTPQGGKAAFSRLEAGHQPDLYISVSSIVSMAVAPFAEQNQVPIVGLAVSAAGFTSQNKWLFRYHISAEDEARAALSSMLAQGVKKLGILYQDDGYGRSVWEAAKRLYEKNSGRVISSGFQTNGADLLSAVNGLEGAGGIYIAGFKASLMKAIRELKKRQYAGPIAATSAVVPGPDTEGVYTAAPIIYKSSYSFVDELRRSYREQYNKKLTHYVVGGYDFLKLLAGLMEERPVNRETIHQTLLGGFIHNGLFGNFKIEAGQQDIYYPVFSARIVDGQLKFL